LHEYPAALQPEIVLCRIGEGPFAANAGRIKQLRVLPVAA